MYTSRNTDFRGIHTIEENTGNDYIKLNQAIFNLGTSILFL